MTTSFDATLAAIDGALADVDLPDAMRWSPTPADVDDAGVPYQEDEDLTWTPWTLPPAPPPHPGLSPKCMNFEHAACASCRFCTCHDQQGEIR